MTSSLSRGVGTLLAAVLVLAGCGSAEPPESPAAEPGPTSQEGPSDPAETTTQEPDMPDDTSPTSFPPPSANLPTGPVPPQVVDRPEVQAAMADLAGRLNVEESAVSVAGHADVTWRDGALGCPQPGMMYTQALVPGEQLVLEVEGQLYAYHAPANGTFSYCADPQDAAPGGAKM